MKYELAKKLKDAGYPIKHAEMPGAAWSYSPTLEELIEEVMGTYFFLDLKYCGEEEWEATGMNKKNKEIDARGKTPTEAVANLWLILNQ